MIRERNRILVKSMRYALDVLDRANAYTIGTVFENNPTFRIFLDEEIDEERLRKALAGVFACIPYMKSRLVHDGIYCLEDNPAAFPIHHCRFEDRPLRFGKETNGYLFQISYDKNELVFDWSHIATDGLGFLQVTRAVLAAYYGIGISLPPDAYTRLPVEEHYDSGAGKGYLKPQAEGFDQDRIGHSSPRGTAHCTTLSVPARQILTYRERVDATPAAIISALIAETFRAHLKKSGGEPSESNNVRCKIVVSTRPTLKVTTLHNCFMNLFVTYTDAFDRFDFSTVCTIFRAFIDLAIQEESVLNEIRMQKETLTEAEQESDQKQFQEEVKQYAVEIRKRFCNFNFSYLGVLPFEEELMAHIVDFQAICINENSEFGVFAYAFRDRIYLTVCENYTDSDMVSELIETGRELDITFEKESETVYRQAFFEFPDGLHSGERT